MSGRMQAGKPIQGAQALRKRLAIYVTEFNRRATEFPGAAIVLETVGLNASRAIALFFFIICFFHFVGMAGQVIGIVLALVVPISETRRALKRYDDALTGVGTPLWGAKARPRTKKLSKKSMDQLIASTEVPAQIANELACCLRYFLAYALLLQIETAIDISGLLYPVVTWIFKHAILVGLWSRIRIGVGESDAPVGSVRDASVSRLLPLPSGLSSGRLESHAQDPDQPERVLPSSSLSSARRNVSNVGRAAHTGKKTEALQDEERPTRTQRGMPASRLGVVGGAYQAAGQTSNAVGRAQAMALEKEMQGQDQAEKEDEEGEEDEEPKEEDGEGSDEVGSEEVESDEEYRPRTGRGERKSVRRSARLPRNSVAKKAPATQQRAKRASARDPAKVSLQPSAKSLLSSSSSSASSSSARARGNASSPGAEAQAPAFFSETKELSQRGRVDNRRGAHGTSFAQPPASGHLSHGAHKLARSQEATPFTSAAPSNSAAHSSSVASSSFAHQPHHNYRPHRASPDFFEDDQRPEGVPPLGFAFPGAATAAANLVRHT